MLRSGATMGMQPILPTTLSVKITKGATRQCYSDGDGVVRCEQTFKAADHCVSLTTVDGPTELSLL